MLPVLWKVCSPCVISIEILPEKDGLDIEIVIAEGEQYLFDGYLFTGNTVFSEQVLKELTAITYRGLTRRARGTGSGRAVR